MKATRAAPDRFPGLDHSRLLRHGPSLAVAVALGAGALSSNVGFAQEREGDLEQIIITATARPEDRRRIPSTVQVIDADKLAYSSAKSLTDLLAESGVAFFSEWTPGQTSMNIRGGASDGQGKDFRGQVLVLVNGRRAGTANLSKLSPSDVARVEIVRGPASVVYGSQNIGGVINLVTNTGRSAPDSSLQVVGGTWGLQQGHFRTGFEGERWDAYVGLSAGERDDYGSGDGNTMLNTGWERWGINTAFGVELNDEHRLDIGLRTNGVYESGFRGSGGNLYSRDNRFNRNADVRYQGTAGSWNLDATAYVVEDIDDFRWASPIIRSATNLPAPGTAVDNNYRELDIRGVRFQPRVELGDNNELLVGADWERSKLRSDRYREGVPGNPLAQVSPQDNNQTETVQAVYFEDAHSLLNERLVIRGGVRYTDGETSFDPTPNLAAQLTRTEPYDTTTWSVGTTFRATDAVTLRAGASTGFRAPTATELAADFNALGGGRIFGNPDLDPEQSEQLELGANIRAGNWLIDTVLFENVISDRITTLLRPGVANTSDYINNPGDIVVRGVEWQLDGDLMAGRGGNRTWTVFISGAYNFDMEDEGAPATANTRQAQRMYEYQTAVGTRFGGMAGTRNWSVKVEGILRGPMWYDTEESLLVPEAEPNRQFIHEKDPFWIVNLRADFDLSRSWTLFAAINNLLDENEHPIFIAIDETPTLADLRFYNGAEGTSMPGRDFQVGARWRF